MMHTRRPTVRSAPLTLVAFALLLAGCGVPAGGPEPVPTEIVPVSPGPVTETPPALGATVGVAWVRRERLVVVDRVVEVGDREERVNGALGALLGGPDDREARRRLTTSIPPGATAVALLDGRRAIVDVDFGPAPVNSALAAGQVALTALSIRGVHSVLFTVNGVDTNVTLPSGKDSDGPVTAKDYK